MEGQLLLSINFGSSLYASFVQQTIVCQRVLNIGRLHYLYRPWGTVWCTSMCVGGGGGGGVNIHAVLHYIHTRYIHTYV